MYYLNRKITRQIYNKKALLQLDYPNYNLVLGFRATQKHRALYGRFAESKNAKRKTQNGEE